MALDLRNSVKLPNILITEGISYAPSITGITNLDSNYTMVINNITKNVGNGITLLNDGFVFEIGANDFTVGEYKGYIKSDSRVAGLHVCFELKIICYADNC